MADEKQLLRAARDGDAAAMEALLREVQPRLQRFGMSMCGHREDAEEVVQHTMLTLAQKVDTFREEASLSTWLFRIARSFCIKERRRSKFAPEVEETLDDDVKGSAPLPSDELAQRQTAAQLRRGLALLDPEQREVIVLRDVQGLSTKEVAQVLELSEAAVKSRLHRARTALRDHMNLILSVEPPSVECPDLTTMFSRHLEGELGPTECAEMEAHLETCPRCEAACDCLKQTLQLCKTSEPGVPSAVDRQVRRALEAYLATRSCETS